MNSKRAAVRWKPIKCILCTYTAVVLPLSYSVSTSQCVYRIPLCLVRGCRITLYGVTVDPYQCASINIEGWPLKPKAAQVLKDFCPEPRKTRVSYYVTRSEASVYVLQYRRVTCRRVIRKGDTKGWYGRVIMRYKPSLVAVRYIFLSST